MTEAILIIGNSSYKLKDFKLSEEGARYVFTSSEMKLTSRQALYSSSPSHSEQTLDILLAL